MPKPIQEMSSWGASSHSMSPEDAWAETRAQTGMATQILRDKEDYLGGEARDIGRRIDERHRELFVSCDPGEAMQQQFEILQPEFIAIHDLGAASSRRLIAGIGAATGRGVHKLIIRRQGHGVGLATIEFTEVPAVDGTSLRLYTTEVDADTASRHELARVLLAFSRLGVLMVGDLPPHAMSAALKPLSESMTSSTWRNRNLLLLPLASASALASQAAQLGAGTGVTVRTTPQVTKPADAWNFIAATWNRLRDQVAGAGIDLPALGGIGAPAPVAAPQAPVAAGAAPEASQAREASIRAQASDAAQPMRSADAAGARAAPSYAQSHTQPHTQPQPLPSTPTAPAAAAASPIPTPLPMQPMPEVPTAASRAAAAADPVARYVHKLLDINGMVSACVFEVSTQRSLAHAGSRPGPAMLAIRGSALVEAILDGSRALGLGASPPDAAITLGDHHLVLRPISGRPGLMLHAVLDKTVSNLTLARLQIMRLDPLLDPSAPATTPA